MISVQEAEKIILSSLFQPAEEIIPIDRALGRVLSSDIRSDSDLPPFDRIMMDGIAIRFADWEEGLRSFPVQGVQQAGEAAKTLQKGMAIEVMTGAICPTGADCIIPYEEIEIADTASITTEYAKPGQHIHKQGSDKQSGDVLIKSGTRLNAAHLMIAASAGFSKLMVLSQPRIHIFSTGDELVEIDEQPLSYQIRRSNVYGLKYLLEHEGFTSTESHLADDKTSIRATLEKYIRDCDVILLSGGVSKGKFDFIPEVLNDLGVKQLFHGIAQKPGKPFWFGTLAGKFIFAFPGNPVSTMMCATRYLIPWLRNSFALGSNTCMASLAMDFEVHSKLTYFLQVSTYIDSEGIIRAIPFTGKGSGDYANLSEIHAFAEIPAGKAFVKAGELVRIFLLDNRLPVG